MRANHLRDLLQRNIGERRRTEVDKRHVSRIADVELLEMVLPGTRAQIQHIIVRLEKPVAAGETDVVRNHRDIFGVGNVADLQLVEVVDDALHLGGPLLLDLVPVLVVVAGSLHELRNPPLESPRLSVTGTGEM